MLFFILIITAAIGIAIYVFKKTKSTNLFISTTPPSIPTDISIHDEIAKTIEEIKSKDPVVIEAPFIPKVVDKVKKKTTQTKSTTKSKSTKATPKMSAKKTVTKKSTKK
jgi:hypothetical protein